MNSMKPVQLSSDGHFFQHSDGAPFFYLADTAWELFHRCDRGEIEMYFLNRAAKGFTVVQAVIVAECDGPTVPNCEGQVPFIDADPGKPNEKYFELVDYALDLAEKAGLYMAILPTWASWVIDEKVHPFFKSMRLFDEKNAASYGRFLGTRYRDRPNLIWILGGDRRAAGYENVWNAMGHAMIDAGDMHPRSYHPGGSPAARQFPGSKWLTFNFWQSGHGRVAERNYETVFAEYQSTPAMPFIDGEPCYEDHPIWFHEANGRFTDFDVRRQAYWAVFAGAAGHTYGCHSIWQMYDGKRFPLTWPARTWKEALNMPGSYQMRHLRTLIESRPYFTRIPDQSVVKSTGWGTDHVRATRDGTPGNKDATWMMAYTPLSKGITLDTSWIPSGTLNAWIYDPKHGIAYPMGAVENTGTWQMKWHLIPWHIPQDHTDWVFVVDDALKGYGAPGR